MNNFNQDNPWSIRQNDALDKERNIEKREEQKATIKISHDFWNTLMNKMHVHLQHQVENIEYFDVVFNSS